jgi:hypothetical protein
MKAVKQMNKLEDIFARDNKFCFEKKAYKQLLNIKPRIMMQIWLGTSSVHP